MNEFEQRGLVAVSSYISSLFNENDWIFIKNLIVAHLNKELSFDELQDGINKKNIELTTPTKNFCITVIKGIRRSIKLQKARLGDVFYFEYVNPLRTDSRNFCIEHHERTYHLNEIKKMKNNQIEPVLLFCGGWGCIHDWEADPFYEG